MNLKTDPNRKESTPGETKKHKEQIAEFVRSLIDCVDPFHKATPNMATDVEIPGNIKNGPL